MPNKLHLVLKQMKLDKMLTPLWNMMPRAGKELVKRRLKPSALPKLRQKDYDEIRAQMADSIREMEELIGMDLSEKWNYKK